MAAGRVGPVISVEMPVELAQRLEGLAIATNRPITEWVVQAVEDLIALRDWQVQAIQEGIDDVGRGDVVSHSDVVRLLNDWDADSAGVVTFRDTGPSSNPVAQQVGVIAGPWR